MCELLCLDKSDNVIRKLDFDSIHLTLKPTADKNTVSPFITWSSIIWYCIQRCNDQLSNLGFRNDTPYLSLSGELWGVYHANHREYSPCHNSTAQYQWGQLNHDVLTWKHSLDYWPFVRGINNGYWNAFLSNVPLWGESTVDQWIPLINGQ